VRAVSCRLIGIILLLTIALMTLARRENSGAWIAFASNRNGDTSIFMMTGDGEHQRKIARDLSCATAPQWSLNGRWIAFYNPCLSTQDLQRIRPGGSALHVISTIPSSYTDNTRLSPDREELVVMRGPSSLYILHLDGGGEQYLAADYYFPQWSPDGDWIYARPIFDDRSSLDRIHVRTGEAEELLPPGTVFTNPSWSPDASQIVIAMPTDHGDELFSMSLDGETITAISDDLPSARVLQPRWSPDGEWIAFLGGEPPFALSVYRIRPDGSDLQRLIVYGGNLSDLQWSPGSDWLLFVERHDFDTDILRVRADGSSLENLTPGGARELLPQYAPVSGFDWHPLWLMTVAALGLIFVSLMGRFRI
jgi:Tol biopolymer transport system component